VDGMITPIPISSGQQRGIPPVITSLSPYFTAPAMLVTINGSNFGSFAGGTGDAVGYLTLTDSAGSTWSSASSASPLSTNPPIELHGWGNHQAIFTVPASDSNGYPIASGLANVRLTAFNYGRFLTSNPTPLNIAAQPPAAGLSDGSNYVIIGDNNTTIQGLVVTITVGSEIVLESGQGFQFALFCYSSVTVPNTSYWSFFLSFLAGAPVLATANFIVPGAQTFPSNVGNLGGGLNGTTIPAGYTFSIWLAYNSQGQVTGANVQVTEPGNPPQAPVPLSLPNAEEYLTPIWACQLIVISANQANVTLSSGSGLIEYQAVGSLLVTNDPPPVPAPVGTANCQYALMSSLPGNPLQQSFSVSP
jgi:hypothetical protein